MARRILDLLLAGHEIVGVSGAVAGMGRASGRRNVGAGKSSGGGYQNMWGTMQGAGSGFPKRGTGGGMGVLGGEGFGAASGGGLSVLGYRIGCGECPGNGVDRDKNGVSG